MTIIMTMFFIFLLPFLFVGPLLYDFYSYYLHSFLLASPAQGQLSKESFSLYSMVHLLLPRVPAAITFVGTAAIVLFPLIPLHRLEKLKQLPQNKIFLFGLYLLASLFIAPMSETHHLTYALPSVLLVMMIVFFDETVPFTLSSAYLIGIIALIVLGKFTMWFYFFAILGCYLFLIVYLMKRTRNPLSPAEN